MYIGRTLILAEKRLKKRPRNDGKIQHFMQAEFHRDIGYSTKNIYRKSKKNKKNDVNSCMFEKKVVILQSINHRLPCKNGIYPFRNSLI